MATFARHADVDWTGGLLDGTGTAKAGSGAFSLPVTFPSRIAERADGKVRLWPAALYGLLRELEKADFLVESDERPAADQDDERRRYVGLTPLGKRVLEAEVRRLEAIVNHVKGHKGGVAGIYNRAVYMPERKADLELWADRVAELVGERR